MDTAAEIVVFLSLSFIIGLLFEILKRLKNRVKNGKRRRKMERLIMDSLAVAIGFPAVPAFGAIAGLLGRNF